MFLQNLLRLAPYAYNHGHNILRPLMFDQIFLFSVIIVIFSNKHGIYELHLELPSY